MISNQLFDEVYQYKGGYKAYCTEMILEDDCPPNLNDVATECKRWIKEKGLTFAIYHHADTVAITIIKNEKGIYSTPPMTVMVEEEAIFKASKWLLENKDDK